MLCYSLMEECKIRSERIDNWETRSDRKNGRENWDGNIIKEMIWEKKTGNEEGRVYQVLFKKRVSAKNEAYKLQ